MYCLSVQFADRVSGQCIHEAPEFRHLEFPQVLQCKRFERLLTWPKPRLGFNECGDPLANLRILNAVCCDAAQFESSLDPRFGQRQAAFTFELTSSHRFSSRLDPRQHENFNQPHRST